MATNDDAPLTRVEFYAFMDSMVENLNKVFINFSKRFDDIERRLERLESDVHTVQNEARLIHPMFELVRTDGAEVGQLKLRVDKLEKQKPNR